jgi:hypothetical protein
MAWYDHDSWLTAAFAPRPSTILFTFLLMILVPVLLHIVLYRSSSVPAIPSFLVLGPSGSGKTSLVTHVRSREIHQLALSLTSLIARTRKSFSNSFFNDPPHCGNHLASWTNFLLAPLSLRKRCRIKGSQEAPAYRHAWARQVAPLCFQRFGTRQGQEKTQYYFRR